MSKHNMEGFLNKMDNCMYLQRKNLKAERDICYYFGRYLKDGSPVDWCLKSPVCSFSIAQQFHYFPDPVQGSLWYFGWNRIILEETLQSHSDGHGPYIHIQIPQHHIASWTFWANNNLQISLRTQWWTQTCSHWYYCSCNFGTTQTKSNSDWQQPTWV